MILSTQNLSHTYNNDQAIDFPDLELEAGKKVLIQGFSGSGKTTLLNLIAGALRLQSGKIDLAGYRYTELSSGQLDKLRADHIGYVFQTLNLIPFLSVKDNIALGVRFSSLRRSRIGQLDQEIERLIGSLGLDSSVLTTPVNRLSIGQQQRVAVARALLGKPSLLLADEPTSALDQESTQKFLDEIGQTFDASSQAILVVSHDRSLAPSFDQVIEFNPAYV